MQLRRWIAVNLVLLTAFARVTVAQSTDAGRRVFTLEQAIDFALKNYPSVLAALERTSAAEAGVGLARTNYLPHADALWQGNRASRNNILGLLLPNSTIPTVSGPELATTSGRGAWGSAAGLLFSWEAFDFGRRRAEVDAARAARNTANAEAELTRLDVAIGAVNAYLTLLAADAVIQKTAHENEACRRLVAIPGIGPVTATALIAAIGNGGAFHKGREFAAWMGVVPREHSTGGQQKLLGISKRGNSYLRRLFVQGARAVLLQRTKQSSGLSAWLAQLTSRTHRNVAAVALANKLARIAWAVLAKNEQYRPAVVPDVAAA